MAGLDAVLTPTAPVCAPLLKEVRAPDAAVAFTRRVLGLTRVANLLGMTACSVPIARRGPGLPVGMDVAAAGGSDLACMALAVAIHSAAAPVD
jgi:Asp-tRNA(Asn)/Glu-tRNA(Gln) amidotransferase A subunit family amidase